MTGRSLVGAWVVVQIRTEGALVAPIEGPELTLEVEGGRVAGSGGINRFMGALGSGEFLFGPLATTLMAGPPALMEQEHTYLTLLGRADSARSEPGLLTLIAEDAVVLVLREAETD